MNVTWEDYYGNRVDSKNIVIDFSGVNLVTLDASGQVTNSSVLSVDSVGNLNVDGVPINAASSANIAAIAKMPRKEILTWSSADIVNQYKDLRFVVANDSMDFEAVGNNSGTSIRVWAAEGTDYTINSQVPINVSCVADVSSSLNNKYFLIGAPANNYYVWFNVGGAGVDPGLFKLAVSSANATVGTLYINNNRIYSVSATISAGTALSMVGIPLYVGAGVPAASGTLQKVTSFTVSSNCDVVAGSTYTNNGQTFTVLSTLTGCIGGATVLFMSGTGTPAASGSLVLASGPGTTPITFSAQSTGAGDAAITFTSVLNTADPVLYDLPYVGSPRTAIPVALSVNDTAATVASAVATALKGVTSGTVFQASVSGAVVSIEEVIFNIGYQAFVPPGAGTSGFSLSSPSINTATSRITLKAGGILAPGGAQALGTTFNVGAATATVGATYTNNGQTFTVLSTVSGATTLYTAGTGAPATPPATLLGLASAFALLAGSAITNTGSSNIVGNVGVAPGSSITAGAWVLTGSSHSNDSIAQAAQVAANSAYSSLNSQAAVTIPAALDGQTLTPGVYTEASGTFNLAASGAGTLTLNGNGIYVFICSSTLVTGAGGIPTITLAGGALSSNVYWIVRSSATINSGFSGTFRGNIIAQASITDTLGGTVNGSLIALTGAVTLSAAANVTCSDGPSGILTLASGTGDAAIVFLSSLVNNVTIAQYLSSGIDISPWDGVNPAASLKRVNVVYDSAGNSASFPYWSIGSGTPIVIYPRVHNDFRSIGAAQWRDWSDRYQIVVPCAPDTYLSPIQGNQAAYQVSNAALFMANFIKALGAGPAHLFSTTGGCQVILRTAIDHPELVRSVISSACTTSNLKSALSQWALTPAGIPFAATIVSNEASQVVLFTDMYNTIQALPVHGPFLAGIKSIASANNLYPGQGIASFGGGLLGWNQNKQTLTDNALLNELYFVGNFLAGNPSFPQFPALPQISFSELQNMKTPVLAAIGNASPVNFTLASNMLASLVPNVLLKVYVTTAAEPTGNAAVAPIFNVDVLNWLKDK